MNRKEVTAKFSVLKRYNHSVSIFVLFFILIALSFSSTAVAMTHDLEPNPLAVTVNKLSSFGDRSTGTKGCKDAAGYIKQRFSALYGENTGHHTFSVPVRIHEGSTLTISETGTTVALNPLLANIISPETIGPEGASGPLIYTGSGEIEKFNGKTIKGSIILMELDSGTNWLHAANLGAKALIYVDRNEGAKTLYEDKTELSPVNFPRFRMPPEELMRLFGDFENLLRPQLGNVELTSKIKWQETRAENIYCLIPGRSPDLKDELVIVESFYDSRSLVAGIAPGADESLGISALIDLAGSLKENPPERSVLLVATSGHAQTLAGMREMIWSIRTRSRELKLIKRKLKSVKSNKSKVLKALQYAQLTGLEQVTDPGLDILVENSGDKALQEKKVERMRLIHDAINERIKTETDIISRRLMRLRLEEKTDANQKNIAALAKKRLILRRIGWNSSLENLNENEKTLVKRLIPYVIEDERAILDAAKREKKKLDSALKFRSLVKKFDIQTIISLHLSSHGDGFGAFNKGFLYGLKPSIRRVSQYSLMNDILLNAGKDSTDKDDIYKDTLRPSRLRSWQDYLPDQPELGGEVSALAGYLGLTFSTVNDNRAVWGTPLDRPDQINWDYALRQNHRVCELIRVIAGPGKILDENISLKNGFSTVTGKANFIRHGELFADQAAPDTVILSYQGPGKYHSMTNALGTFCLKGVADKKHVLDKVIIEGYKFDPETGKTLWAIDKKQTGKPAYRLKMRRLAMKTDLIMFSCRQSTLFNLLTPRGLKYMTKIQLLDGRLEAPPGKYWYSRIDTRISNIASVYLEPGTWYKMTLSDTVLTKKLILTNGTDKKPEGTGYRIDDWPFLDHTELKIADDMWTLLEPRIDNLETHGIFDARIQTLRKEGTTALKNAKSALIEKKYDKYLDQASKSWALATRVYKNVEKTQKDVLFGVLFYIALFVPFAFCMEKLLFSYSNIHYRILAFSGILLLLITVIYNVHPAFQLAYSPTVVILAFFIMGLSLMVTLIIFFRFENEMEELQQRAGRIHTPEISRWKALTAAFFLGVSNLRRRRIRTALTCMTLIILTFTIMSFTSVKTGRHHTKILYNKTSPYHGFLMSNVNWQSIPQETLDIIRSTVEGKGIAAPRVWLEATNKSHPVSVQVRKGENTYDAQGIVGLSANEREVSGIDAILTQGQWFKDDKEEYRSVILEEKMAQDLGIDLSEANKNKVLIWGVPFTVTGIFSGDRLMNFKGLDREPLTPVTFPDDISSEMTEVEMEAIESGEDIQASQSRYKHISGNLTIIIPYRTLLASGGTLKSIAIKTAKGVDIGQMAHSLTDRFRFILFAGEPDGTFLYHAGDSMKYSGVPNIIIPLIISIFIVLNTMIGSVYERKSEIAIYTSVGLAPSHVSFLFIAEAMAFAILSVSLGYILAQTSASIFAGTSLWEGLTVNYSSLGGVAAMMLVMLVVLVSVIYPSRVAARIAIPDVNRSWAMPNARQNTIELTLPFLIKISEQESAGGFIVSHFMEHQDVSHGLFSTGNVRWKFKRLKKNDTESGEETLFIRSKVWLAPFDFGIMQHVVINFLPSNYEKGFLEIRIRLVRETGEVNAWGRVNKAFVNDLRKQLLIWRSVDENAHNRFRSIIGHGPEDNTL